MARNQRGQLPVMSRKQEWQTDHADSGRQGYECGWRLSFRPARSALRSWTVGCLGVRVPDLRLPSRSELLSMMQRLVFGGIPSFFAAPFSPSRRLKRLQSVLSPLCSDFRPTAPTATVRRNSGSIRSASAPRPMWSASRANNWLRCGRCVGNTILLRSGGVVSGGRPRAGVMG
jgi:hypothetical protein